MVLTLLRTANNERPCNAADLAASTIKPWCSTRSYEESYCAGEDPEACQRWNHSYTVKSELNFGYLCTVVYGVFIYSHGLFSTVTNDTIQLLSTLCHNKNPKIQQRK